MPRVKIKSPNSKDPRRTSCLLEILSKNGVYITKLIPLSDGYIIITGSEDEQDKIFKEKTENELKGEGFQTITPPELKASRSVIIPSTENHIYKNNEADILEEIYQNNTWTTNSIDSIFKFPNSRTLKITFKETSYAKKAQTDGLRLFQMSIPHYNIKQEVFYNITTCFRCYELEDHFTNQCKKPTDYKICSECSSTSHTWRECLSLNKKCLNCQGAHRTLAAKCPMRKDIIKNKRTNSKQSTATYSQITKQQLQTPSSQQPNTSSPNTPQLSNEMYAKIYTCIMHAHMHNLGEPGRYNTELNNMLAMNSLPQIKAPPNPPSAKIINKLPQVNSTSHTPNTNDTNNLQNNTPAPQSNQNEELVQTDNTAEEEAHKPHPSSSKKHKSDRHRSRSRKRGNTKNKIKSTDIGLTIFTPESIGLPESTLSGDEIFELISNKTFTAKIESYDIDYFRVIEAIKDEKIEYVNCFKTIADDLYKKLRPGREMLRSPPDRQEKIRKNSQ